MSVGNEAHHSQSDFFSVHELSQFVYCPRAGLIATEAEKEDEGVEGRPTDLSYLPEYSLINIEAAISRAVVSLLLLVTLGVVAAIAAGIATLNQHFWGSRLSLLGLLGILIGCGFYIRILFKLLRRRKQAMGTQPREPIFLGDGAYPIHWWELRAAGFAIRRFESILRDPEMRIKGRPWAILVRGTECVPVFRMCGENERVYANHMVRVAGYCHLIEANTNYECPFGIVLLPRRLDAMAVPHTPQLKAKLQGALEIGHHTLALEGEPDEPANKKVCINCPFGRPRKYVAGQSTHYYKTQPLVPYTVEAGGRSWHTPCGDRFKWLPPTLIELRTAEVS